jgi:hypothetical protein
VRDLPDNAGAAAFLSRQRFADRAYNESELM